MAKLFNIKMEEMSQDILDMGLMKEAQFQINGTEHLNDSILVADQLDEATGDGVEIKQDQDVQVLDLMQEKLPKTDVIVTVHE